MTKSDSAAAPSLTGPGQLTWGVDLNLGLHRWSFYKPAFDRTDAELDFGFGFGLDGGVRLAEHVVLQLVGQYGYTFMVDDYKGWQFGLGAGVRVDRYWPGWIGLSGVGDFGSITKNAFSLDFSGGGLILDGGWRFSPLVALRGQISLVFLNHDLGHQEFTVGVRFGN